LPGSCRSDFITRASYVRPDTRVVTLVDMTTHATELNVSESAVNSVLEARLSGFRVSASTTKSFPPRSAYVVRCFAGQVEIS